MLKNRITNQLQKQGKTQAWLSELTGISKGMMSQIVSGRSVPTAKELSLICGVLGCRYKDLYGDDLLTMITGRSLETDSTRKQKPTVRMTEGLVKQIDDFKDRCGCISRDETARMLIYMGMYAAQVPNFFEYKKE